MKMLFVEMMQCAALDAKQGSGENDGEEKNDDGFGLGTTPLLEIFGGFCRIFESGHYP